MQLPTRMRRLRAHPGLRRLVQRTACHPSDWVLPVFVSPGPQPKQAISALPGHYRWSLSGLSALLADIQSLGLQSILLFPVPEVKDGDGRMAMAADGFFLQAVEAIRQQAPDLLIMADLCLCDTSDHGHCGLPNAGGYFDDVIDNDQTLALLAEQAVCLAQAGCDVIAPSGMIDGMVAAIRQGLDSSGCSHIPILSYAVKFASHLYGPFRQAAGCSLQFGHRRGHQMDMAAAYQAVRECQLDCDEGADCLMVKPAGFYLDVIAQCRAQFPGMPLAAYQVSGEYAMLKAMAEQGLAEFDALCYESLCAIKRAGADFTITYAAMEMAAVWARCHGRMGG